MKAKYITIVLSLFIILFTNSRSANALSVESHQGIAEQAAIKHYSDFALDIFLKTELDMKAGLGEQLSTLTVLKWLKRGALNEDKPPYSLFPYLTRSPNHFHNPITGQGFSGFWWVGFLSGMSSTQWALLPIGSQDDGDYSWNDVRDYYFQALTTENPTARNTYYAHTFRGLGQLMHLVQDASVPSHTRNDAHAFYNYETWVKSHSVSGYPTINFTGVITNMASLIDTNQYNGTTPLAGTAIGLSEYTNANFFSEDTIESRNFNFPKVADATLINIGFANNSTTIPRKYYKKNCCGETNGGAGYLLSTVDYLDYYRVYYFDLDSQIQDLEEIAVLDKKVYADYASLLIPRAIGYSSDLLKYFFRAKIDMILDPDISGQYVVENSSTEQISGIFTLYYDDIDGNRTAVPNASWPLTIDGQVDNVNGISEPLSFFAPTFPEPKDVGKYMLVFKGNLGSETGNAVAGKVVNLGVSSERILYSVGGQFKTYDPVTNEVDIYNGPPINGEIVKWSDDATRVVAYDYMGGAGFFENGWRGNDLVKLNIAYDFNTLREEYAVGGVDVYTFQNPALISNYLHTQSSTATSWNGEEVAYLGRMDMGGPCYARPISPRDTDQYILRLNTVSKNLAYDLAGEYRCVTVELESEIQPGAIERSNYLTFTDVAMIAYQDSTLKILNYSGFKNSITLFNEECYTLTTEFNYIYDKIGASTGIYEEIYFGLSCNQATVRNTFNTRDYVDYQNIEWRSGGYSLCDSIWKLLISK